jgi:hypothetical protein
VKFVVSIPGKGKRNATSSGSDSDCRNCSDSDSRSGNGSEKQSRGSSSDSDFRTSAVLEDRFQLTDWMNEEMEGTRRVARRQHTIQRNNELSDSSDEISLSDKKPRVRNLKKTKRNPHSRSDSASVDSSGNEGHLRKKKRIGAKKKAPHNSRAKYEDEEVGLQQNQGGHDDPSDGDDGDNNGDDDSSEDDDSNNEEASDSDSIAEDKRACRICFKRGNVRRCSASSCKNLVHRKCCNKMTKVYSQSASKDGLTLKKRIDRSLCFCGKRCFKILFQQTSKKASKALC